MPRICISIVTYNHGQCIEAGLKSLQNIEFEQGKFDIHIIDNASKDNTWEVLNKIKSKQDNIILNKSNKNLGFSGGHNKNIKDNLKNYDYFWLYNPDAIIKDKNILDELVKISKEENDNVILQPVLYNLDDTIGNAGNKAHFLGSGGQATIQINSKTPSSIKISAVSGAAMFLSKEVVKKIGYLEDFYLAYHEDVEYSWRASLYGVDKKLCTKVGLYHDHVFESSKFKFFLLDRNKLYKIFSYYDFLSIIFLMPSLLLLEITTTVFFIMKGWRNIKIKVYKDIWTNREKIRETRKKISKIKNIQSWQRLTSELSGSMSTKDLGKNKIVKTGVKIVNVLTSINFYIYKVIINILAKINKTK